MAGNTSGKLVGALAAGLKVLRYLSQATSPVGVTRIARDLNLNPSTCYNLLKTLVQEGLVNFDEESKTYTVALGLVELAKGVLEEASYVRLIHPVLEEVARRHNVTATLWQRTRNERVVLVARADSDTSVRVHMNVGQRLPMYIAALGRCLAAHSGLSTRELKKRFDELRWDSKPSFDGYLAGVNEARRNGYAIDEGNFVQGVSTASAAILDEYGRPIMALSAVGFSAHFDHDALDKLGQYLRDRAAEITRSITGNQI